MISTSYSTLMINAIIGFIHGRYGGVNHAVDGVKNLDDC